MTPARWLLLLIVSVAFADTQYPPDTSCPQFGKLRLVESKPSMYSMYRAYHIERFAEECICWKQVSRSTQNRDEAKRLWNDALKDRADGEVRIVLEEQ